LKQLGELCIAHYNKDLFEGCGRQPNQKGYLIVKHQNPPWGLPFSPMDSCLPSQRQNNRLIIVQNQTLPHIQGGVVITLDRTRRLFIMPFMRLSY
jgi:hypothetical protein